MEEKHKKDGITFIISAVRGQVRGLSLANLAKEKGIRVDAFYVPFHKESEIIEKLGGNATLNVYLALTEKAEEEKVGEE